MLVFSWNNTFNVLKFDSQAVIARLLTVTIWATGDLHLSCSSPRWVLGEGRSHLLGELKLNKDRSHSTWCWREISTLTCFLSFSVLCYHLVEETKRFQFCGKGKQSNLKKKKNTSHHFHPWKRVLLNNSKYQYQSLPFKGSFQPESFGERTHHDYF